MALQCPALPLVLAAMAALAAGQEEDRAQKREVQEIKAAILQSRVKMGGVMSQPITPAVAVVHQLWELQEIAE